MICCKLVLLCICTISLENPVKNITHEERTYKSGASHALYRIARAVTKHRSSQIRVTERSSFILTELQVRTRFQRIEQVLVRRRVVPVELAHCLSDGTHCNLQIEAM